MAYIDDVLNPDSEAPKTALPPVEKRHEVPIAEPALILVETTQTPARRPEPPKAKPN